jgi:hypothetical protein
MDIIHLDLTLIVQLISALLVFRVITHRFNYLYGAYQKQYPEK